MPDTSKSNAKSVRNRWRYLVGDRSQFSLEARIFHSISIGAMLMLVAYIPYNLLAGLYVAAITCIVLGGMFFYEFYRSRFILRPHRSFFFGAAGLVIMSVNYFANSGIQGSTDLIWPTYLLFVLTICPYNHVMRWTAVYVAVFGVVHVIEHLHPELVQFPFRPGDGQFTDRITAFPLPVITIALVVGLFRRNYDRERATVAQRDQEKSRLLSILSHDLRAPFIQVQQYLEMLESNDLSSEERSHLEQVLKQNNDQTLHLVTNLLFWSRSQLDGISVQLINCPLLSTIENTLEMAGSLSRKKGISLVTQIDPTIRVKADADMLQLVLRNLLQNAVKFTPTGGTISVNTQTNDGICYIRVSDTGNGIPSDQLPSLFSGVAPSSGTANEKGVGLGLQLCKEFMERQGGSIEAGNNQAAGATFTIGIPLAEG